MVDKFQQLGCCADMCAIVVTYNSADAIGPLLADLRQSASRLRLRVIVVDNESSDQTAEVVKSHPDVVLLRSGGNIGYAGGINAALPLTSLCDTVLILNPDLRVRPYALETMFDCLKADDRIGATVPRIHDPDGSIYPSLRRELSVTRALGDAVFGRKLWLRRPSWLSDIVYQDASYKHPHDVDWANGAAVLFKSEVVTQLGGWDERFFLYSEETEYMRRLRDHGYRIRFEPHAAVEHELGGSGFTPALAALMAVNRVRYVQMFHGRLYTWLFRVALALGEGLRSYDRTHRQTLMMLLNRKRWKLLPHATKAVTR